ncbi:hypothetical protein EUTSA_v10015374mg [Eutrema salsugineum]|uniref:Secreted protein n=1 Tax=Eutrema salsugineum TaxID=72664 RepID=V4LR35_EUTSA|nr:hypothetical protein EUTSA_v10015374mg [Eutrema salsugineum]
MMMMMMITLMVIKMMMMGEEVELRQAEIAHTSSGHKGLWLTHPLVHQSHHPLENIEGHTNQKKSFESIKTRNQVKSTDNITCELFAIYTTSWCCFVCLQHVMVTKVSQQIHIHRMLYLYKHGS